MSRTLRQVKQVVRAHRQLEGGGFSVRRPFPTPRISLVDPFLLLDEMGPVDYKPGEAVGAPDHPHRGFETVTYMLEGEFEHEDSAGHKGKLAAGDVQWMTAGAGVVHSEEPSARVRAQGGRVHGFQIWVNLPAKDKMMAPRYQEIPGDQLPLATTPDGKASVRVIAGEGLGARAVIDTVTPITYLDFTLVAGASLEQAIPEEQDAMVYVFGGALEIAGQEVEDGNLAILTGGSAVTLASRQGGRALVLAGKPIAEPVARYGPFVMNSPREIEQAIRDFQAGRLGQIQR